MDRLVSALQIFVILSILSEKKFIYIIVLSFFFPISIISQHINNM